MGTLLEVMVSVRVESMGAWTVVRVSGELDMATAPQLRQVLVGCITDGRRHLVVDLADVAFVDSTGLGVLIGGLKRARSHDGDLVVAGLGERLRKVFEITDLDRVLASVDLDDLPELPDPRSPDLPDPSDTAGGGS